MERLMDGLMELPEEDHNLDLPNQTYGNPFLNVFSMRNRLNELKWVRCGLPASHVPSWLNNRIDQLIRDIRSSK
jgi:hypothetical protein